MSERYEGLERHKYENQVFEFTCLRGIVSGMIIPFFFKMCGMKIGTEGVEYYGEVHLTFWNSFIHTLFMPFTISGILIAFPALLRCNKAETYHVRYFLFCFYFGHYIIALNPLIACVTMYYYYSVLDFVNKHINLDDLDMLQKKSVGLFHKNNLLLLFGLTIMTTSLIIQELVGHKYGGDDPSRIEAVPNAILYAMYYSVSHLFTAIYKLI